MTEATLHARLRSPYARYGLWRNPFGELQRHERAALAVVEIDRLLAFVSNGTPRCAIQFLGECGFGKTTHLLALKAAVQGARYVYFPEQGPRPALPRGRSLLLVDEAQRMGWLRRRQMLAYPGPLAIGTHVDLSARLEQAGFRLRCVAVGGSIDAETLVEILSRRIAASRIPAGMNVNWQRRRTSGDMRFAKAYGVSPCKSLMFPAISHDCAQRLIDRFGSDVRAIEHYLFDRFQDYLSERIEWPPAI